MAVLLLVTMSKVQGWLWKCDRVECGYAWYAPGVEPPKACAKCKSRKWHLGKNAAEAKPEAVIEQAESKNIILEKPEKHWTNPLAKLNEAKYGKKSKK